MEERPDIPRLLVAGASSGVGKTTVTVGLVQALQARGLRVAAFKCGPDYLDPTYHARVAGACHNLDGWMMGRDGVLATFQSASRGADIAVIEGMMGLFDGASPDSEEGSSAEIAKWLKAPVILVVDASGIARTIAAVAQGFSQFDSGLELAALACNRVGSRGHLDLLRQAAGKFPIAGGLPNRPGSAFPERHLGLVSAGRDNVSDSLLAEWGSLVGEWFDLPMLLTIARSAPALRLASPASIRAADRKPCRIGLAFDDAFHFYYEDNLRRLEALGARLIRFSPVRDASLPEVDGLYLGGGYPEVMAGELAANSTMREAIRVFAAEGGPVYAECGGLMYLAHGIRTLGGQFFPMVGLVPGEAVMSDRIQALGYVEVETREASILGPAGLGFRGHQFRYSSLEGIPAGFARLYSSRTPQAGAPLAGYRIGSVVASYVHAHWASNPEVAAGFVRSCAAFAQSQR